MRFLLWTIAAIACIVVVVALIGWGLPVQHTASRDASLAAPPQIVYDAVRNVAEYPAWRSGVTKVEMLEAPAGVVRFREHSGHDAIVMEIVEATPPGRMVTRIADPGQPFGGTWTFDIAPAAGGSTITIIERGEVYNPIFRFVARFVFGHFSTLDHYLKDLGAHVRRRSAIDAGAP